MISAYKEAIKNFANFKGRMSRKSFWHFFFADVLITILLIIIGGLVHEVLPDQPDWPFTIFMVYRLGMIIPNLSAAVRRLHDAGRSGMNMLFGLFGIGVIILFFFFLERSHEEKRAPRNPEKIPKEYLQESQHGVSQGTSDFKKARSGNRNVIGWVFGGIFGIGLLIGGIGAILHSLDPNTCQAILKDRLENQSEEEREGLYINPSKCFTATYDSEIFYLDDNVAGSDHFFATTLRDQEDITYLGEVRFDIREVDWSIFHNLTELDGFVDKYKENLIKENDNFTVISEKSRMYQGHEGYEIISTFMIDGVAMKSIDIFSLMSKSLESSSDKVLYIGYFLAEPAHFDRYLEDAIDVIEGATYIHPNTQIIDGRLHQSDSAPSDQ